MELKYKEDCFAYQGVHEDLDRIVCAALGSDKTQNCKYCKFYKSKNVWREESVKATQGIAVTNKID